MFPYIMATDERDKLIDLIRDNFEAREELIFFMSGKINPKALTNSFQLVSMNTPQWRDLHAAASPGQVHGLPDKSPATVAMWLRHGFRDMREKTNIVVRSIYTAPDHRIPPVDDIRETLCPLLAYDAANQRNEFHNLRCIFGPKAKDLRDRIDMVEEDQAATVINTSRAVYDALGRDFDADVAAQDKLLTAHKVVGSDYFSRLDPKKWKNGAGAMFKVNPVA